MNRRKTSMCPIKYIIFDTETTGLPTNIINYKMPLFSSIKDYNSARLVQLSWAIYQGGKLIEIKDFIIKPDNFNITNSDIHGITDKIAQKGAKLVDVISEFIKDCQTARYKIGHNIQFDNNIISSELYRYKLFSELDKFNQLTSICTMQSAIPLKINRHYGPKLVNLYKYFFKKEFEFQHNAKYDVIATADVFHELLKLQMINI